MTSVSQLTFVSVFLNDFFTLLIKYQEKLMKAEFGASFSADDQVDNTIFD